MVESETTKAAEMCLQLQAENRWFVTGTPLQREISGEWKGGRGHTEILKLNECHTIKCIVMKDDSGDS